LIFAAFVELWDFTRHLRKNAYGRSETKSVVGVKLRKFALRICSDSHCEYSQSMEMENTKNTERQSGSEPWILRTEEEY
jgi:hypothetical protein